MKHLGNELSRRGHRVSVIAPLSDQDRAPDIEDFRSVGGVVPVPANGSIAYISISLGPFHWIKRFLDEEGFDIVHIHEPLTPMLNLAVLQHSNAVNIGTFHAYGESSPHYQIARPILRPYFKRLDGRIAVSSLSRGFASRYFGGDFRVIPNGVDVDAHNLHGTAFPELMDDRPNVLFLGRFEEERKGFDIALEALSMLRHTQPNVRLVVVGRGESSKYREVIRQLGIERHVHFAGAVSDEDRARYMASCHMLIAPNTGGESQGLVVLEAMAAGLPVVASNIPAFANVIRPGKEGTLVQPGVPNDLASAVARVLAEPETARQMSIHAKTRASGFNWPKIVSQLVEFYAEVYERKAWQDRFEQRRPFAPSVSERVRDA